MQANYVQRQRLIFSKDGPARYIGHLDLARTIERSLSRAEVPIAYTQGFNKRPRLSFAAPLPLGYTSEYELADIWLMHEMDSQVVLEQIMSRIAPGITITNVSQVPLKSDSLQSLTTSATYVVSPHASHNQYDLPARVKQLLAQPKLIRERKRGKKLKRYDLRPLINSIITDDDQKGITILTMELLLLPGKSGRPDEVLAALGLDPLAAHVHRTQITLGR